MNTNQLELSFSSIPENVSIARMLIASVGAQLDLPLNDIEEIKVAVSEAVSNSIIHGYKKNPQQIVYVILEVNAETLKIIIRDEGSGIPDIKQAMQPAFSTDPERMGLGFVFMQSFMDELYVESTVNEGTSVTLIKYLSPSSPSSH